MLVALWAGTHAYQGFARDGELYAVQALSRLQPALGADIYLQNTSQDQFTIFSRIYSSFIGWMGLRDAALLLLVACQAGFFAAAWALARALCNRATAWLSAAALIVTVGYYGSYKIFHFAEDYLTARSAAEALVVTALAFHFHGRRVAGALLAMGAMFVHPLMVLPGLLLLLCLWLPLRQAAIGAAAGVLASLGLAIAAIFLRPSFNLLAVLDPAWLEVVRERSQFLFLNYWTMQDWELNARPFVCLAFSALAIPDARIRKLCLAAMLVGASGLAVALVAGAVGPVAILLQGQAWRWTWITGFTSILLLAPTVLCVWRDPKCGPICSVLLVMGWMCSAVDGLACVELALAIWLLRLRIDDRLARGLAWAAGAAVALALSWVAVRSWDFAFSPPAEPAREALFIARVREFLGLGVPAALLVPLFWRWIGTTASPRATVLASVALFAVSAVILPGSLKQLSSVGSSAEIEEFADWRAAMPPASNVLIAAAKKSASFAWFTLQHPSYTSVDQSSGVVFSRATALEIRRRSQVLLPLREPDWQILTQISRKKTPGRRAEGTSAKPLTAQTLVSICGDPQLGFVVARESLGFDPIRHESAGNWKDWNLYDCRHVR
jgi:hypothetical protein